jgi:hypothetical protein
MVAAFQPLWSLLPNELERKIFISASRDPQQLYNYILVARRVKPWLVNLNSYLTLC